MRNISTRISCAGSRRRSSICLKASASFHSESPGSTGVDGWKCRSAAQPSHCDLGETWRDGALERISVKRAADLVEYAETAAKYEYLNLLAGEIGEGLSAEEIRSICKTFNIEQDIF